MRSLPATGENPGGLLEEASGAFGTEAFEVVQQIGAAPTGARSVIREDLGGEPHQRRRRRGSPVGHPERRRYPGGERVVGTQAPDLRAQTVELGGQFRSQFRGLGKADEVLRHRGEHAAEAVALLRPGHETHGSLPRRLLPLLVGWILAALALPACRDFPPQGRGGAVVAEPRRVVSLDYCADQFVLEFVERERILALSPDSQASFSYLRERARGLPQVRPRAEEVLSLSPDLIVRSYGGGPHAGAFFGRAGVPVVQIGFGADLSGVRQVILETAAALDARKRGRALVEAMDARLAAVSGAGRRGAALYMTPGGVTAGPGTLVHELLEAAGYSNFQQEPGYRELPLERLAHERPDRIAAAFYEAAEAHQGAWSAARHPVARRRLEQGPVVFLEGAWTACGGWFLVDAVEALAGSAGPSERLRPPE